MVEDPDNYVENCEKLGGAALKTARTMQSLGLLYSAAQSVLDIGGYRLREKEYYNLQRNEKQSQDLLAEIQKAVRADGFHIASRETVQKDDLGSDYRRLEQLFVIHRYQIKYLQRFMSETVLIIDSTFNTNRNELPLSNVTGITKTGASFS
ncbi:hypothetical protein RUND412_009901, partial [Rhizina undulata]